MTRKESEVIVESILDSIVKALHSGDKVEIRGFGVFRTRRRQPRIGRNLKTGTRVEVPAKKIPYFKPTVSSFRTSTATLAKMSQLRHDKLAHILSTSLLVLSRFTSRC
jgi:nucleoid DNA-binding protein